MTRIADGIVFTASDEDCELMVSLYTRAGDLTCEDAIDDAKFVYGKVTWPEDPFHPQLNELMHFYWSLADGLWAMIENYQEWMATRTDEDLG